jgi:hypothetical protein
MSKELDVGEFRRGMRAFLMGPRAGFDPWKDSYEEAAEMVERLERNVDLELPENIRHFLTKPARRGSVRFFVQATVFYCGGQLGMGALLDVAERYARFIEQQAAHTRPYFYAEANLALIGMAETMPDLAQEVREAMRWAVRDGVVHPPRSAGLLEGILGELLYR